MNAQLPTFNAQLSSAFAKALAHEEDLETRFLRNEPKCNVEQIAFIWLMENELDGLQRNDNWVRFSGRKERPTKCADGRCSRTAVNNRGYSTDPRSAPAGTTDGRWHAERVPYNWRVCAWQVAGGEYFLTNCRFPVPLTRIVVSHIVALT